MMHLYQKWITYLIHQAPVVGPTDPANNAVNVPLNKIIKIVFNEQIQPEVIDLG